MKKHKAPLKNQQPSPSPSLLPPWITWTLILSWILWSGKHYFSIPSHQPLITESLSMLWSTPLSKVFDTPLSLWMAHIGSLLWIILFHFICFHIGDSILRKAEISGDNPWTRFGLADGLGFIVLSMLTFVLASFHALHGFLLILLQAMLLIFAVIRHQKIYLSFIPERSFLTGFKEFTIIEKCTLLTLVLFIGLIGVVSFSPEIFYDSLVYHLALPSLWFNNHSFVHLPYLAFSTMPSLIQLTYCWGFSFSELFPLVHGDVLAKLLHFSMGIITITSIYGFAASRWGRITGLLSALLLYAFPVFTMNSWTSGNDVGTGLFQTLAVLCLLLWHESVKDRDASSSHNGSWFLSAVFLGAALSSKYTGLFGVTSTFLVAGAVRLQYSRDLKSKMLPLFLYGLTLLAVWSPWLIKNTLTTSNPLHPFLYNFLGAQNLSLEAAGSVTGNTPGTEFNLLNLLSFSFLSRFMTSFWRVAMEGTDSVRSIGPLLLMFGPMIFFVKKWPQSIKLPFAIFCLSYFFWFLGLEFSRYLVPVYPCLALAMAFAWTELSKHFPSTTRWIPLVIPLSAAFAIWSNLSLIVHYTHTPWSVLTGQIPRDDFLGHTRSSYPNPSYKVYSHINANLPKEGTRILLVGDNKAYHLKRDFYYYTVEYNVPILQSWISEAETGEDLFRKMKKENLTHMVINYREFVRLHSKPWDQKSVKIFDTFWNRHVRQEPFFAGGTYLYAIVPDLAGDRTPPLNIILEMNRNGWARNALVQVFMRHQMWDNAIDEVESWIRLGSPAYEFLAGLYENRKKPGDAERAVLMYRNAIQRNPKNVILYKRLANIHIQKKEYSRALEVIRAGMNRNPQDPELQRVFQALTKGQ